MCFKLLNVREEVARSHQASQQYVTLCNRWYCRGREVTCAWSNNCNRVRKNARSPASHPILPYIFSSEVIKNSPAEWDKDLSSPAFDFPTGTNETSVESPEEKQLSSALVPQKTGIPSHFVSDLGGNIATATSSCWLLYPPRMHLMPKLLAKRVNCANSHNTTNLLWNSS